MSATTWNEADTARAIQFWQEYQKNHDVTNRVGETAGIDPVSGRVWFGESAQDIGDQMEAEGVTAPFYAVRVGSDFYLRKGGRR